MTEIEFKLDRIARWLASEKLDGVLIGAQHNFAWLTAGGRNGIDQSRDQGAGFLLLSAAGQRWVLANSIEMDRLQTEELAGQRYAPVEFGWADGNADPMLVVKNARQLCGSSLGSDLGLAETRPVEAAVSRLRFSLTPEEIQRLGQIGRQAGEILGDVCRRLQPGVQENEIVRLVTAAMLSKDLWPVVLLVAADDRIAGYRHPVPKRQVARHSLLIGTCVRRGGLIVSLSRMVHFGRLPDELARRTRLTARVNAALFSKTVPGVGAKELYAVCQRGYAEAGFPGEELKHHQGGATGYRTRDWIAHPLSQEIVQPSQAFAWNPTITGTKVEETAVATSESLEILTTTPNWPSIEAIADGTAYLLPDVLEIK